MWQTVGFLATAREQRKRRDYGSRGCSSDSIFNVTHPPATDVPIPPLERVTRHHPGTAQSRKHLSLKEENLLYHSHALTLLKRGPLCYSAKIYHSIKISLLVPEPDTEILHTLKNVLVYKTGSLKNHPLEGSAGTETWSGTALDFLVFNLNLGMVKSHPPAGSRQH